MNRKEKISELEERFYPLSFNNDEITELIESLLICASRLVSIDQNNDLCDRIIKEAEMCIQYLESFEV